MEQIEQLAVHQSFGKSMSSCGRFSLGAKSAEALGMVIDRGKTSLGGSRGVNGHSWAFSLVLGLRHEPSSSAGRAGMDAL
jgi:hypothetical protein